jgi:hypothetical protein
MARQQNLGTSAEWFVGEDKTLPFEIYSDDEVTIQNVTGWAMTWVLRKGKDDDPIVLTKTTGGSTITITGSYNADPDTNTQRVNVLIEDTDTEHFQPGKYYHTLKRTTAGSATVLSYGDVHLKKAGL